MLDQGICIRVVLIVAAWLTAATLGSIGWVVGVDALRQLGLAFVGIAAVLTVLHDNARLRRLVWRAMQEQATEKAKVRAMR